MPRGEDFPAHAVVQLQLVIDLPAILGIQAGEVVPVVQVLVVPLWKEVMKPTWKFAMALGYWYVCRRLRGLTVEAEAAVRLIDVHHVELAHLNVPAKGEVVIAFHPVQVVVERVVVADQPANAEDPAPK